MGLKMDKKIISGAEALIQCLENKGVEYIFGYPGGAAIPIFDALVDSKIKLILTRHEQGATHMADGYARATGRPGVVLVWSRRYQYCDWYFDCANGLCTYDCTDGSDYYPRVG